MEIPALLLARMGVHEEYRGKDIGTVMMAQIFNIADEISEKVGCRFLYTDAKLQSVGFYEVFGLEENKGLVNMILDLETIK